MGSNLTNEIENHSLYLVDQWIVSWITLSLLYYSVTCTDYHCYCAGGLDGVERTNKTNIKYLISKTFLKCDGVDSRFVKFWPCIFCLYFF